MNSIESKFMEGTAALESVGDLVRWSTSQMRSAGVYFGHGTDNAADEARALVFSALHLDFLVPDYFYSARVTPQERQRVLDLIWLRISTRQPAAYLLGEAWFAGLRFKVDERVLIPRSPLAELITSRFEPWLSEYEPQRILDLCTGSGCIAIACSYAFPEAQIDALELDTGALEVARQNVELHGCEDRLNLIQSDLYAALDQQRYDLIVTNPPYVPARSMAELPKEYQHEPRLALEAADNGLALVRKIVRQAANYLTPNGIIVVEVGESEDAAAEEFADLPLNWCEFEHGGEGVFVLLAEDLLAITD